MARTRTKTRALGTASAEVCGADPHAAAKTARGESPAPAARGPRYIDNEDPTVSEEGVLFASYLDGLDDADEGRYAPDPRHNIAWYTRAYVDRTLE